MVHVLLNNHSQVHPLDASSGGMASVMLLNQQCRLQLLFTVPEPEAFRMSTASYRLLLRGTLHPATGLRRVFRRLRRCCEGWTGNSV